jgi:ferredoxin-NADP reductase/MOSC domain-containing protein YiiM
MARLISLNVGLPRDIPWEGKLVHTGIWKDPVEGRRMVRRLNIDGDGQGDLGGHGGEQRAVFVYQLDSHRYWSKELNRTDLTPGIFGENFTVDGLPDDEVCIGDRYRIGTALFEVTQPRVTCYRVGIRMNEPRMASLLVAHHRPGFYLRVIEEGEVGPGDEIIKTADGPENMTVAEIDALLYLPTQSPGNSRDQLQRALSIPALSPGWQGSFREMLQQPDQPTGASGLTAHEPPPAWPGFRTLRVAQVTRESNSIFSFVFEPKADNQPLSPALPGQFIILRIQPTGEPPILRNYSLSGPSSADRYRISVKREQNGAASTWLHTHLRPGDTLDVAAPRGTFTLLPGDGPVVFLSAGVGITPVLAMLHQLATEASPRPVWWLYGARCSQEHPFRKEVTRLLGTLPNSHTHIRYSRPRPADCLGLDFNAVGHLDTSTVTSLGIPHEADFYLCGPTGFLHDLTTSLAASGIPSTRIHSETFGTNEAITPGIAAAAAPPPHPPEGPAGPGPNISFARSGLSVPWNPKFQNLLEFAEACDVPVRWSCRTGVCHTCESDLISGTITYRPEPLLMPAQGKLLICCSQPGEELVIDL